MIVSWMMGFAQRGDAFRRLIGNAVTARTISLSLAPSHFRSRSPSLSPFHSPLPFRRALLLLLLLLLFLYLVLVLILTVTAIADLSREVVLLWLINFMHFPVELQKLLNEFFLVMFTDQVFKRKFAGHFVKQYRSLFFDEVSRKLKEGKKEKGADILGLSIQLFTIPAFMEDLVKVVRSTT